MKFSRNLIVKCCLTVVATLALLIVFAGCDMEITPPSVPTDNGGDIILATKAPTTESPATEIPTAIPTDEPTAVPTELPADFPPEGPYIDTENMKFVYANPGETVSVGSGITEKLTGWIIDNESVATISSDGESLSVKGVATGYATMSNTSTGEVIYVYVINAIGKTDENKVRDGLDYFLYYEKGSHTLTVYTAGDDGYYTVPVRTISCACGSSPAKTPVGLHTLKSGESNWLRWKTFSASCHAQYGISYASGVWLHSTCYSETRENSVISYYYDSIGASSTGGCLRMQVGHILWIWNNCAEGTLLKIVDGSPLGTASERPAKLSDSAMFDPTDPAYKEYLIKKGFY